MFMRVSTRLLPCVVSTLYKSEDVPRKAAPLSVKKEQHPYYDLSVKIRRTKNIVGGDFLSSADCYVSLHLPTASAVDYKTKIVSNDTNSEWDETFNFRIQSMVKHVLELSLYHTSVKGTKHLSTVDIDIGKFELGHDMKAFIDLKDDEQLEVNFRLEKWRVAKVNVIPLEEATEEIFMENEKVAEIFDKYVVSVFIIEDINYIPKIEASQGAHKSEEYKLQFAKHKPRSSLENDEEQKTADSRNSSDKREELKGVNAQYSMSVKVDGAYEEEQITTLKPLSNPVWNEDFFFHIDKSLDPTLKIDLIQTSTELQEQSVDLRLKAKECYEDLDVRLSYDISEPEKEFLSKRKKFGARALKAALNLKKIPKDSDVPVVAILASGGGIRAMTSLYGVLLGLQQLHILDCITYIFGVSGSTWCMSTLYQDANWSDSDLKGPIEKAKHQVTKSKTSALSKDRLGYYINALVEKNRSGHNVSITDLWGLIIESFLFGKENKTKLSDQQRAVRRGQNPYPIYASLNVRSDLSARDFGEWFEYTPYEAGLPKYGAYIPIQHFGSRFFMGYLIKKCPEIRLSFLQGQWGSAFAANLEEILREMIGTSNTWMQSLQDAIRITDKHSESNLQQPQMRTIIPAGMLDSLVKNLFASRLTGSESCNFLRGLFLHRMYEDNHYFLHGLTEHLDSSPNHLTPMINQLYLVDAGFSNNSAFPLALRSPRCVDVILSFSFSRGSPFRVLKTTEEYCTKHNVPFPKIDVADVLENSLQECYVFMDENNSDIPIVIHFPLTNATFKDYKSPGVERTSEEDKINSSFVLEAEQSPYSTLNFTYTPNDFDKLVDLNCYNVLNNKDIILMSLKKVLAKKS
ncbi:cytosolic phospholipase A2 zeta-like [Carcharodon carcharias]|uniref:cytosolic phospholipase A2 zeta-like n=1 Tax=Carcharodon carcharias TaxID=13397 RepID=UPI001B7F1D26|nr:cytosolic phospholipase A2 zeta-like [Carcharodon carcharias]